MWKSFPIAGRAILTEDTIKGVRNAERVAISRADRFTVASSVMRSSSFAVSAGLMGQEQENNE